MSKAMYYDEFTNEYVSQEKFAEDVTAPPERYLLTVRGVDGVYCETYENNGERLDIAYSEADLKNGLVNRIRFGEAERHGWKTKFQTARMVRWCIPCSLFDKYYKRFVEADE